MQDLRNVHYIVVATNNQHAIVQAFAEANGVSQMLGGANNVLTIQHITTSDSVPLYLGIEQGSVADEGLKVNVEKDTSSIFVLKDSKIQGRKAFRASASS